MNQEIRVVAVLLARDGKEQEVERILRACVLPSRAENGCLSYVLHRDLDEPGRFVFIEGWADHAAIDRHRLTPHYKAMANALIDLLVDRQVFLLDELNAELHVPSASSKRLVE
ncbi:putative quinol monooxygenase [Pseudomonas aeruginosa]|uniref:putative quinol monooxygenase n=1 Tax=Pseudomonas aeruginosa TaxID=287 RepID=UPI000F520480|nr:putative quinol monooxygenase [Pseudomonas aeruginosa]RPM29643.1 antibiotic biosynthesis monooxygenase [Pseudomonas aeruginosa]